MRGGATGLVGLTGSRHREAAPSSSRRGSGLRSHGLLVAQLAQPQPRPGPLTPDRRPEPWAQTGPCVC